MMKKIIAIILAVVILTGVAIPFIGNAEKDYRNDIVDVFVIDGQSNAEDWGSFASVINTEYDAKPVRNIYYYGSPTSTTHYNDSSQIAGTYGIQPMYSTDHWVIGGYGPILCNEYAKKNNHDVCYINIGYSGQSITTLIPTGAVGTWGFNVVDSALSDLRERYNDLNMIGWIWAQGEADKTMSTDTYITNFDKIQSKFDSYGFDECYIVHTRESYGGNATIAQNQIAESDKDVTMTCLFTENFTVANGELYSDGPIHYTQKGRIEIAKELASVIPISQTNTPVISVMSVLPILLVMVIIIGAVIFFFKKSKN